MYNNVLLGIQCTYLQLKNIKKQYILHYVFWDNVQFLPLFTFYKTENLSFYIQSCKLVFTYSDVPTRHNSINKKTGNIYCWK